MKSKFTRGPWEASDLGDYGDFDGNSRVILGDDRRIAVVQVTKKDKESNANALLIAAAPDMFEALVAVLHRCNDFETEEYEGDPMGKLVISALKKAKGKL